MEDYQSWYHSTKCQYSIPKLTRWIWKLRCTHEYDSWEQDSNIHEYNVRKWIVCLGLVHIWPKKWPKSFVMEKLKRNLCSAKSSNYKEELGEPFCRYQVPFLQKHRITFSKSKKGHCCYYFWPSLSSVKAKEMEKPFGTVISSKQRGSCRKAEKSN